MGQSKSIDLSINHFGGSVDAFITSCFGRVTNANQATLRVKQSTPLRPTAGALRFRRLQVQDSD